MQEKYYKKGVVLRSDTIYRATEARYDFYLEDTQVAEKREYFSVENLEAPGRVAFLLKDLKNVVLDFGGATLVFHGRIIPFILDNCENVTLKNYKIDYDRPFYTQASVLECDSQHMRIHIDDGFSYRVEDGYLYVFGDTWEKKLNRHDCLLWLFDRTGVEEYGIILALFGPEIFPHKNPPLPIQQILVEEDGEDLILKGAFPENWSYNDGNNSLLFTHEKRDKNTITLVGCTDIHIENFILIHGASMAITGMRSKNIYIDNFSMYMNYEGNNRLVTNNADGVHLFNCSGEFELKNSYMEGLLDDTLNIHNNYFVVKENRGKQLVLECGAAGISSYAPLFTDGDKAAIFRQCTQELKGEYTVVRVAFDAEKKLYIYDLDREAEGIEPGDVMENLSAQPTILMENCVFGRFRGTMRPQSRSKTVIRNCEFRNRDKGIIFTGDTTYWYESGPVNDFTIENCKFYNTKLSERLGCYGEVEFTEKENYYHKNITVKDCYFDGGTVAVLRHVDHFTFKNNTSDSPMTIKTYDCANVEIENARHIVLETNV